MPYISEFNLPAKPVGLALAGGGVRGCAQIAVLEVMQRHGYAPDMVAGTSIGSFMATMVAMGLSAQEMFDTFHSFESKFSDDKVFMKPNLDFIKPTKNKINGIVDGDLILGILDEFFAGYGVKNMSDIKKPLVLVAVDDNSSKVAYFTNVKNFDPKRDAIVVYDPSISFAIRSSCSFPGMISASKYEDMSFVDGGARMNLPVEPLKAMGAYKVMSLTMSADKSGFVSTSAVKTLKRATDLLQLELMHLQIEQSDFNINLDVGDIKAFDVGQGTLIYKRGEIIARDREEDIVNFFEEARKPDEKPSFFKRLFGGKKHE